MLVDLGRNDVGKVSLSVPEHEHFGYIRANLGGNEAKHSLVPNSVEARRKHSANTTIDGKHGEL